MRILAGLCSGLMLLALARPMTAQSDDPASPDSGNTREVGASLIRTIGTPEAAAWKFLTPEQQSANVAGLKDFATRALADSGAKLTLTETPHFLIYSNVHNRVVREDAQVLEDGYALLSRFFKLRAPKRPGDPAQGTNIWRGKLLIFLFREEDFPLAQAFVTAAHPPPPQVPDLQIKGYHTVVITLVGNGSADVIMAQKDDEQNAERRLASAMAEAFVYRLYSSREIEPWVFAGLIAATQQALHYPRFEENAGSLPPDARAAADEKAAKLIEDDDFDDLLTSQANLREGMAFYESLTAFMLQANPKGYADFVLGLKSGLPVDECLEKKFGLARDRLKDKYLGYLSRHKSGN